MRSTHRMTRVGCKSIIFMVTIFCLAIFLSGCSAKVDNKLLGTWQSSSNFGFSESWTFKENGRIDIVGTAPEIFEGVDVDDWYYRAEDGKLEISPNGSYSWPSGVTYEYQFGVSETGTQCLILSDSNGISTILYKE